MAKKIIPITEVRKNLFKITEEVQKPNTYYTLTVEGRPQAVILSYDEFDSIMETMEIMSDPQVAATIEQSKREFERGEFATLAELEKELGYSRVAVGAVADKAKKPYTVRMRRAKKSKK